MHTLMLLDDTYPPDIRVRKETGSLLDAGHDVTLLSHREEGQPEREVIDGIDVIRQPLQNAHVGPRGWLNGGRYLLTHIHHTWLATIESILDSENIDVLHVHDLPLVKTAITVGKRQTVPVIADLHENWPEAVRQYRTVDQWHRFLVEPSYLLGRIATPIRRLKRLERSCIRRVDRTITVAEEAKAHYVQECGADPYRVHVVPNVVKLDHFNPATAEPIGFEDEFTLTYVGTLGGEHRGLQPVIDALPSLRDTIPEIRLLIVGSGDKYERVLQKRCRENDVEDTVTFTGWVDFEDVPRYIAASDVCLVPHRSTPHTETTLPHKLFQYMALGRPVIVTNVTPLARIVGREKAGIIVPPSDHQAIDDAVTELYNDPELAKSLGANGRKGVEERYNWSHASEALLETYRQVGGSPQTTPRQSSSGSPPQS